MDHHLHNQEGIRKISFLRFYLTYTMEQEQEKKLI